MEFIDRPVGANLEEIHKLETIFQITLPESMLNWWSVSDGALLLKSMELNQEATI
ncbi:hypothetical protein [Vibrio alginolyticus]|uniref:hypothetical protein n=1 Tax=Vibrio alginolyticus TaxID=663 RepID=UPI003754D9BA